MIPNHIRRMVGMPMVAPKPKPLPDHIRRLAGMPPNGPEKDK